MEWATLRADRTIVQIMHIWIVASHKLAALSPDCIQMIATSARILG
jgi:hypothetical protein